MNRRVLKWISPLLALAIFLVALWALNRTLDQYDFRDILQQLHRLPPAAIFAALALSVASYLLLSGYDHLALRYLGRKLPAARVTLVSFSSYAFSHNVGFSLLTGGSIRYRMYSSWGLSAEEVARLTAFAALSFTLGMITVGSLVLLLSPADLPHIPYLPLKSLWPLAFLGLAVVAGYLLMVFFRRQPVRLRGWEIPLPPRRYGIGQILLGATEWTITACVIYPLLPPGADLSVPAFLQIYLLAQLAAMSSHVPGGLGVFETVFLFLVPTVSPPALFGSLLVYRALYYLLPFGLALLLLAAFEAVQQGQRARRVGAAVSQVVAASAPLLLAAGAFAAGALLLLSAVSPLDAERWRPLALLLPPAWREAASFLSAPAGAGLLLVARGVQLRLRPAWWSAALLLTAGSVLSLVAGSGMLATAVCALVLAAFLPGREIFDRRHPLREASFTPWWVALILIVHATAVWLGIFSLREVGLSPTFAVVDYSAAAARILLAGVAAALVLLLFAADKRLRPLLPFPASSGMEFPGRAAALAVRERSSFPQLALLGDHRFLLASGGEAFLAYAERETSCVCLGDPAGAATQRPDLLWRFRDICERRGKRPVFLAIGEETARLCLGMGLVLQPVGREGLLPLFAFALADLPAPVRDRYRQAQESGCVCEIVPPAEMASWLPALQRADDLWRPAGRGLLQPSFDPDRIGRFPVAIVRREAAILAFASLPPANGGADLILGLWRATPEREPGLAEFLLAGICLWGREAGLSRLNLGIVPTPDAVGHLLAPTWQRLGPRIFPHGDLFANLDELRAFKEGFRPYWQAPLYLACPDVLALPEILAEIAGVREGRG